MKILNAVLSLLYKIWVGLVFTVFMILLLPGIVLPFLLGQRFGSIGYAFLWLWSWIFSKLTFFRSLTSCVVSPVVGISSPT